MLLDQTKPQGRNSRHHKIRADLVVVGGGLAGVCTAITAAREGIQVVLVQDRPVLGGNASSEVRLWALGATSHMGNNNRWAREGGVINEILLENLWRNRQGNTLILDTILLEKVIAEPNLTLLLNTVVHQLSRNEASGIASVEAFCSQNSTSYTVTGRLFCDASGDGIVGFLAGAGFRMGAEARREFGEKLARDTATSDLLGHSLYFYSKRVDHPVAYVPPSFALKDITAIPRYKVINEKDDGCRLWWIEYGGIRDTVYDTEDIKWELWKIIYGVWDYIKNSGTFEDVDNLTLEWVGTIPGKRESRRFDGLYRLTQADIVGQRRFDDAVAHGGWAIDIHPAEGVYSKESPCSQWHAKGVYQIPYRCYVNRDLDNLFMAGRLISTSHIAFGSTRVMLTCALGGQAVGMAAALCVEKGMLPRDLLESGMIPRLQQRLNLAGQSIPHIPLDSSLTATLTASSTYRLEELPFDGPWLSLQRATAQLLPLEKGPMPDSRVRLKADKATTVTVELRISADTENHTPDIVCARLALDLNPGEQDVDLSFDCAIPDSQYGFLTFLANEAVWVMGSSRRTTGLVSVFNKVHRAVSNNGYQSPPEGVGIDSFEFWTPDRRPGGHNIAISIAGGLNAYDVNNLGNGFTRPTGRTNAWAADLGDRQPSISLSWPQPKALREIILYFDADFDHALESALWEHPERVPPFCVRRYRVRTAEGNLLSSTEENHQAIKRIVLDTTITTAGLTLELDHPSDCVPAALFEIVCLESEDRDPLLPESQEQKSQTPESQEQGSQVLESGAES